jgi:RNA polymerase sigma-70 factor (ECF subfamily)
MMARRDPLADPEPLIRRVYSYVAFRVGAGPEAEDITSDTFERALRRRGTYDPSRGTPTAWLLGIARRCTADAIAGRLPTVADTPDVPDETSLEGLTVMRVTLDAAIATLDEREQDLIALRYGADLTAKRIAEILDLQTNAVEVALHRALARLRERLEERDTPVPAEPTGEELAAEL